MGKSLAKSVLLLVFLALAISARPAEGEDQPAAGGKQTKSPWIGNYPMSGFVRARTAKVVGKDHLSLSLKTQYWDNDEYLNETGSYSDLPGEDYSRKFSAVLCAKYGWAKDHHLAFGVPYLRNDQTFNGKTLDTSGIGNVYVFEKWNVIKETNRVPAVSVDVWYYFPTGDTERKIGKDDYAWKLTTEISKAWKDFSLHINPGYRFSEGRDCDVIEGDAMIIFTPLKSFWPAVEYNFTDTEGSGRSHDLIPGFVWKFAPGATFKLGPVINLDSTTKFRDEIGVVAKLFYRF